MSDAHPTVELMIRAILDDPDHDTQIHDLQVGPAGLHQARITLWHRPTAVRIRRTVTVITPEQATAASWLLHSDLHKKSIQPASTITRIGRALTLAVHRQRTLPAGLR